MIEARLQITFATEDIEKLCTDIKYQRKRLSEKEAKSVRKRYTQLRAVETVAELSKLTGRWHALGGNRKGQYAGHVTGNKRFIIRGTDSAGMNGQWNACRAIEVVEVSFDYH